MPKPANRKLPTIAVEEECIKIRVGLTTALHADLENYARFWATATGRKPRSMNDLIGAVLTEFLTGDTAFQKWKGERKDNGAGEWPFSMKPDARSSASDRA